MSTRSLLTSNGSLWAKRRLRRGAVPMLMSIVLWLIRIHQIWRISPSSSRRASVLTLKSEHEHRTRNRMRTKRTNEEEEYARSLCQTVQRTTLKIHVDDNGEFMNGRGGARLFEELPAEARARYITISQQMVRLAR